MTRNRPILTLMASAALVGMSALGNVAQGCPPRCRVVFYRYERCVPQQFVVVSPPAATPKAAPPTARPNATLETPAKNVTAEDKQNCLALLKTGIVHYEKKEFDAALKVYSEALAVDPTSAAAAYSRGMTNVALNQIDAAERDLDKAIALIPNYLDARRQRGALRIFLKSTPNFRGAIEDLELYLRFNSKDAQVQYWLSTVLASCPDHSLRNGKRAVELARSACEAEAYKNSDYVMVLAAAMAEIGDFDKAIELARQASDLAPEAAKPDCKTVVTYLEKRLPIP